MIDAMLAGETGIAELDDHFHQRALNQARKDGKVHVCRVNWNDLGRTTDAVGWIEKEYPDAIFEIIAPSYMYWAFTSNEVMIAFKLRWG